METIIKLLASLFNKEEKGVKILFQLLLILFFFSMLALIPLWIASSLNILPNSNITIDNGPSKMGVSYVIEQEMPLKLLDNVEIYSSVYTFDDLKFSPAEIERLDSIKRKYNSNWVSSKIEIIKKGFNMDDNFGKYCYPKESNSFKRFNTLFQNESIKNHLGTLMRKQIFLSDKYWEMVSLGTNVYVYPAEKQISIAVLRILGSEKEGTLYTGIDRRNEDINNALIRATGQNKISIPNNETYLFACVSNGERVSFESKNYIWSIRISDIINVPSFRGDNDVTIIDWSAANK